jgi:hypothetical protein
MPKRRKKFGRSQKRGGDRKLGDGGDGLEYVPLVRAAAGVVAVTNDTQLSLKYIPKKTLLRQLQQIEVTYSIVVDVTLCLSFVVFVRLTHNIIIQPNRLNVNLHRGR